MTMTVTFPAGVTEQTVGIPTIDDSDAESPESFTAMLSNPSPSEVVVINEALATINIVGKTTHYRGDLYMRKEQKVGQKDRWDKDKRQLNSFDRGKCSLYWNCLCEYK